MGRWKSNRDTNTVFDIRSGTLLTSAAAKTTSTWIVISDQNKWRDSKTTSRCNFREVTFTRRYAVFELECQVQEDQLLTQIKTKTLCDNLHLVLNTEYTHHTHITQVRRMEQTKSNRLSRIHLNVLRVTYSTTE